MIEPDINSPYIDPATGRLLHVTRFHAERKHALNCDTAQKRKERSRRKMRKLAAARRKAHATRKNH